MKTVVLNVPDISCHHCERTITGALDGVAGIESLRVDIPQKRVILEADPQRLDLERVKEILAEEDYPVASVAQA